jgi:type I restriction enzyme S subunit
MNAERLLAHFEKISDAPDAVDRLRTLVLSLAYAGKLLPGIDNPVEEWHHSTVGEMAAEIIPGVACSKSHQTPKGHVHLRTHNIATNGRLNFDLVVRIDPKKLALAKAGLRRGDILFNNTNSQELVGKTCLVDQDYDYAFSNHLTRIRLKEQVASEFFTGYFLLLLRQGFFAALCNRWIGQAGINTTALKGIAFAFPPLAEQHRIVAKVDELMQLCDRLEASQQERESRRDRVVVASLSRLSQPTDPDEFKKDAGFQLSNLNRLSTKPEHIKELRKAILNLAVRGKLVPQDEREGTAAECLRTLGLQPAEPHPDSENRDLPPSWSMVRFDDVATVTGGVTLGRKLGGRKTASVPYLRVANVQRGGFDLSVIKEVDVPVEEVEKYALKENDLLMTEGGDWDKVGRSAIWRNQLPLCLHQNHVFRARMKSPKMSPVWFERYFNSPAGRAYFESCSKQTTNLASINMRQVRGCPVPLPPLAEQKRIVAKVDELMLICDQLENQLESQQKGRRQLLEALLHEALEAVA